MQISLAVLRRKKNAESLRADIKVNGPTLLTELETSQAPWRAEGAEVPTYRAQLEEFDHMLKLATERLERADDEHLAEVDNDTAHREARDRNTDELVGVLVDAAITVDRNYGKGKAKALLGLRKGIQPIPDHVRDGARRVVARLGAADFTFGEPIHGGIEMMPEPLRTEIAEPLARLDQALKLVREEERKFNDSLRRKRLAIEVFDRVYSLVADWLKVMYRLAGLDLLADRVKPTIPKPSKKEETQVVEVKEGPDGSLKVVPPGRPTGEGPTGGIPGAGDPPPPDADDPPKAA